jgi:hypothetical protein
MIFKSRKLLLLTTASLILTACGGGDSSSSIDKKRVATEKIAYYAQTNGAKGTPTKQDYIDAGVQNIDKVDIDALNTLIASKEAKEADTLEELNRLTLIVADTTPPVIHLKGDAEVTQQKGELYQDKGATATDDKDGEVAVTKTGRVNTSIVGDYTITYVAVDRFNNRAKKSRTVKVVNDMEAPVITAPETATIKERGDLKSVVTVKDNVDATVTLVVTGDTDTSVIGEHRVVYTAKDKAGNISKPKTVTVTITPFTITELIRKGKNGELKDVSYHVLGDSTRNYPNKGLTILVDSYYSKKLTSNINFSHTSMSGQRVESWLDNRNDNDKFKKSETFSIIDKTKNRSHCIVEFSMGINDFIHKEHFLTKKELKEKIKQSVYELQEHGVHVLLVSPVPYYEDSEEHRPSTSHDLLEIYKELKSELNVSFVSGYDIMVDDYPSNTIDNLHPNKEGLKKLADGIFAHIENDNL